MGHHRLATKSLSYTTYSPGIPGRCFGLDALRLAETVVGAGAPLHDLPGPAATSVHQTPVRRGSLVDVVAGAATVHGLVHRPTARMQSKAVLVGSHGEIAVLIAAAVGVGVAVGGRGAVSVVVPFPRLC